MLRFWTSPGMSYAVNVDHVSSIGTSDEAQPSGATMTTWYCLIFVLSSGHSTKNVFARPETRDAAFRAFCDFVNAGQRDLSKDSPPTTHEASMVRRDVGGRAVLFLTGCTCGWRAPSEGDTEDALAFHVAAMASSDTRES